ncbi:hypothetical protein F5X68DRAFT_173877 [Plectosphaerella plurivora]|uniref:Uncharacterized protein n=1 Tax=Plectosphaerella plurivora TaxID=936078 RepID=A0A9P9A8H0_9PEZI|nr:hypothetical protein F5X68DRAFT_173877 [Plectosphaerella plurivora]
MDFKQSNLPDGADLDSFFDLGPTPDLDMSAFLNDVPTMNPAFDDSFSWNPADNEPGGGGVLLDDTAHQTPISSREPSTGPSTPATGQAPRSHSTTAPASKPVNRFSSESVRLLRQWLKDHESHPYATAHEVEILQGRTGLTKQQVNNWLSNARRRYKFHTPPVSSRLGRASSDITSAGQTPIDIPRRRATPVPFEAMNPLERWESSPPEHDPATVADISRIMAATPASTSTPGYLRGSDISSSDASSVSSAGFSRSSRGSGSSNHTGGLAKSLVALNASRKKRRKASRRQITRRTNLLQPCHTYQCTFCIETFKHKYDWQRHEKSLHLSLEEWVCSPTGPTVMNRELGLEVCVYCGAAEPDQSHLDTHHHSVCQERTPEHRTFYRKDHLRQHLKLVHESNFMPWPMEQWKTQGREIKSRCGFCNQHLETWISRTDHLSEHFKSGYTMAEWKGDWGFDQEVLDIVDNAMPPYLIHYERMSPFPISSVRGSPDTPISAYELLKLELEYFTHDCLGTRGMLPTDDELQYDGCSIIYGADMLSVNPATSAPSWLRDIFLCSDKAKEARLLPLPQIARTRLSQLKINGKDNIFDDCDLELELCRLVTMQSSVGVDMSDYQLQEQAANVVSYFEANSPRPSKHFSDFILRLILGSVEWLFPFKQRRWQLFAQGKGKGLEDALDLSNELPDQHLTSPPLQTDLTISQDGMGGLSSSAMLPGTVPSAVAVAQHDDFVPSFVNEPSQLYRNAGAPFLLNDHNSYTRLTAGLARFVTTTMSPNNPNRHVPTDEELQYQARWMWYNEDDPWNQTPADNQAWLVEFKRGVGLLVDDAPLGGTGQGQ